LLTNIAKFSDRAIGDKSCLGTVQSLNTKINEFQIEVLNRYC